MKRYAGLLLAAVVAAAVAPAAGQAAPAGKLPANLPRKGLVAFWTADGHARDGAGKNHGKVGPGVAFTADRHGNAKRAFLFNGRRGMVLIPDSSALDTDDAFTLSAWINPKAYKTEKGSVCRLVTKWVSAYAHADYCLWLNTDGRLVLSLCAGNNKFDALYSKSVLPKNTWTHIAATFDRGAAKLYINGMLVAAKVSTTVKRTDPAEYNYDEVSIGSRWDGSKYTLPGAIDDVGIWNRAMSAGEVRAVFKGLLAALPQVTRKADADRVALKDGSILLGTIENRKYTVSTFFGKIEVPAKDVVGLVQADKKFPHPRLILTSGQVVAGKLAGKTVQLVLPVTGSTLQVPVGNIREFGYRISKEKPADPTSPGAMVVLASGYRLAWTECKQKLQLRTPGGTVDLPIKGVVNIQAVDPAGRAYRVIFRNGSTLTGALLGEKLTLKLQLGPTLTCPIRNVRGFVMLARHVNPTGPATVRMRNGDRLFGKIADQMLTIRTEFGDVKIRTASLVSMVFDPKKIGQVKAKTWNGVTVSGRLVAPAVTVVVGPDGPSVKVTAAQIASISSSSAQPPLEVLKKAQQLIAQLGAESFADREAAAKALIAMGKGIVGVLKTHAKSSDPEIRQRIQDILEQLGVKE